MKPATTVSRPATQADLAAIFGPARQLQVALTEPAVVEGEGWVAEPLGVHEYRYFNRGRPTSLVRNRPQESYEEQPIGRAAGVPPGRPVDQQIRPVSSLLSTAQARALLDNPPSVRRSDSPGSPKSGASVCTFIPWPIGSQRSFLSVFLTLGPTPSEFPSAIVRKVGTPVQVDGQTAWWFSDHALLNGGKKVPASECFLLTVKDGDEIGVQVTSGSGAEPLAKRTMAEILATI